MADDKTPTSKDAFTRITNPDGTPVRDKDNAQPMLKPEFSPRPAPNLAPPGAMGIRQPRPHNPLLPQNDPRTETRAESQADASPPPERDRIAFTKSSAPGDRLQFTKSDNPLVPQREGSDKDPDIVVDKAYLTQRTWQKGHIASMPGHSFIATVYDKPSQYGIEGGQISKLEVRRYGELVADYDRGWKLPPQGKEQIEAVNRIRDGLEDKHHQHDQQQRPDKSPDMDR